MSDERLTKALEDDDKHKQAVSLTFGSLAPLYDSWYHSPIGRYVWSVETDAIYALLRFQFHDVVLEVGVGTGMALHLLQPFSSQLVGLDFTWQMLAIAHQKFLKSNNVHLLLSDGTNLPFRKECVDLAVGMTVLEFISNRDEFLEEINQCLHPNGYLLLGVLTSMNLWAIDRRIRSLAQHDVFELAKFPSPWQVIRMLYRRGFSQVHYRGAVYAPPFSPSTCLRAFTKIDEKLGRRWFSRALGAFQVFQARRKKSR